MRGLIARRYHYAEDDLPHRPLLEAVGEDGALLPLVEDAWSASKFSMTARLVARTDKTPACHSAAKYQHIGEDRSR